MAPTGTLIPASVDMSAVVGADFQATVVLYSDTTLTTPFDLTGYTVAVDIGHGVLVLGLGSGLAVASPASGTIVMTLTHAQTALLTEPGYHYALKLTDGSGTISFPLAGGLFMGTP